MSSTQDRGLIYFVSIFGLFLLIGGLYYSCISLATLIDGGEVEGKVSSSQLNVRCGYRSADKDCMIIDIEYEIKGRDYVIREQFAFNPHMAFVGQSVPLIYSKHNPSIAVIESSQYIKWLLASVLTPFGFICVFSLQEILLPRSYKIRFKKWYTRTLLSLKK
jgi:hypothetical protein